MITKIFETNRPVFFISDKDSFDLLDINPGESVHSASATTISLWCEIITNEIENVVNIYIDEEYEARSDMQFIAGIQIGLPSRTLEITDSDYEYIFTRSFDVDKIWIDIYVNVNNDIDAPYAFIPENFDIIIKTEF